MALNRYIAFLGGINVSGRRVKMDHLRRLFEHLGLLDVETFIASGNVFFKSAEQDVRVLQTLIERHLEAELGYNVPTFIRTPEDVSAVATIWPFPEPPPAEHTLSVMLLDEPLAEEMGQALVAYQTPMDAFRVGGREVYWLCRGKITASMVNWTLLGKSVTLPRVTVRNVTTIRKLAAKYGGGSEGLPS